MNYFKPSAWYLGKTTVLVECIRQLSKNNDLRILVVSTSNSAVDLLLERCILIPELSNKCLRLGNKEFLFVNSFLSH